jgi:hypothetical protein
MFDLVREFWKELGWFLNAMGGFPLYMALLLFLGLWVFWRGRFTLVEPEHNIDLALKEGGLEDLEEYLQASPHVSQQIARKSLQTLGDQERSLEEGTMQSGSAEEENGFPSTNGESGDSSDRRISSDRQILPEDEMQKDAGAEGKAVGTRIPPSMHPDDPFGEYRRIPFHDAPLWLMSWSILLLIALGLSLIDGVLSLSRNMPHPIETALLGEILPGLFVPLPRPTVALMVYTVLGYLFMEGGLVFLKEVLGLKRLHLLHKNDYRRRIARRLFELNGYRDFRWVDYSFAKWWFPLSIVICGFLLWANIRIFYADAQAWHGAMAVGNLFPVVLVRLFDHVWLYPVKYHRRQPAYKDTVPLPLVPGHMARKDWIYAELPSDGGERNGHGAKPIIWDIHEKEEGSLSRFNPKSGKLFEEFLYVMTGRTDWYDHQEQAFQLVHEGKNVALVGPNDSGRSVWTFLVVISEAIQRAETAVLLYPDRQTCRREYDRFCESLFQTSLCWNLNVLDVTRADVRTLKWSREVPFIVFSDLDSFEEVFLRHWEVYQDFLIDLSLIAFEDVDQLSGSRASNLYFILRRFRSLQSQFTQRPLKYIVTSFPTGTNLETHLTMLLGESIIALDVDSAPTSNVRVCIMRPCEGASAAARCTEPFNRPSDVQGMAADLNSLGYEPLFVEASKAHPSVNRRGFPNEGPLRARKRTDDSGPLADAVVSIVRLKNRNAFRIIHQLRHAAANRPEALHLSFWVARPDPMVALLLHMLEEIRLNNRSLWEDHERLLRTGVFSFSAENIFLRNKHFLATLREMPRTFNGLTKIFGESFSSRKLEELGQQRRLDVVPPRTSEGEIRYRLREGVLPKPARTEMVGEEPVSVEDSGRAYDSVLFQVDPERAPTAFYPGRVFVAGGKRYRVPHEVVPGDTSGRILVNSEEADIFTVKIRRCKLEWMEEMTRIRSQIGPTPFEVSRGDVLLEEEIFGYREWTNDSNQYVATHLYQKLGRRHPVSRMQTQGVEVRFPGEELTEAARHALVHLFRAVVNSRFGNERNCPDVIEEAEQDGLEQMAEPTLRIVDVYPGGVGYAERITPLVFVELMRIVRLLVEEVGVTNPGLVFYLSRCHRLKCGVVGSLENREDSPTVGDLLREEEVTRSPRRTEQMEGIVQKSAMESATEPPGGKNHIQRLQRAAMEIQGFIRRVLPDSEIRSQMEAVDREEEAGEGTESRRFKDGEDPVSAYNRALRDTLAVLRDISG